ncbi:MAG: phage holin family protein [Propionibacteriaceae bacterium]|jgi:putative membrane protein|nr:phage holin family protein [Propionibacteriaceae bacterium]
MFARFVVNMCALALATWIVPGIELTGDDITDKVVTLAIVAVIFGVVNTIVKPLFVLFSAPFIILTLGLMLLVVNGLLLWVTSWAAGLFGLAWHVDGFWAAFFGALIVSFVSMCLNGFVAKQER